MSKKLLCKLIVKMRMKLATIIENSNYNLQDENVQKYSRRLDRALSHYTKIFEKEKKSKHRCIIHQFVKVATF